MKGSRKHQKCLTDGLKPSRNTSVFGQCEKHLPAEKNISSTTGTTHEQMLTQSLLTIKSNELKRREGAINLTSYGKDVSLKSTSQSRRQLTHGRQHMKSYLHHHYIPQNRQPYISKTKSLFILSRIRIYSYHGQTTRMVPSQNYI